MEGAVGDGAEVEGLAVAGEEDEAAVEGGFKSRWSWSFAARAVPIQG